jgi:hypothetical protein
MLSMGSEGAKSATEGQLHRHIVVGGLIISLALTMGCR